MRNWRVELRRYTRLTRWPLAKKILLMTLVAGGSWVLTHWIATDAFTYNEYYTLWLTLLAIGLWVTEAVPAFAVGLLIIGFQTLTLGNGLLNPEPMDTTQFTNALASPIIWLMLGGFFLAGGLRKTGLDQQLFLLTVRYFGPGPKRLLLGTMLTTMLLSMVMSNTATTAMMLVMVLPFLRTLKEGSGFRTAFALGVPIAATLGGMGTLIGSPPNAIAAGVLEKSGVAVSFMDWIAHGFLPAVLLTISSWYFINKWFPSELTAIDAKWIKRRKQVRRSMAIQITIVRITLVVTVLGWLTSSLHQIPVHLVALLPIAVLPLTGIIAAEDFNTMNWDTLVLVAGGLSLGAAIIDTGLAERMLGHVTLGDASPWLLSLVFSYMAMAFSNVVSNTATAAILIPISIQLAPDHKEMLATAIALSASCALLLPVSTPPNAIAMSTGFLQQKDFRKTGLLIGLFGPLLINLWLWLT